MIDVALSGGDFVLSNGDISLTNTDDDNLIQMANSAINTILGEVPFHTEYGNDAWNKRLKIAESGFHTVEICAKEAILNALSDEISDVVAISAYGGEGYGECIVEYTLLTLDGRNISSNTSINIL